MIPYEGTQTEERQDFLLVVSRAPVPRMGTCQGNVGGK